MGQPSASRAGWGLRGHQHVVPLQLRCRAHGRAAAVREMGAGLERYPDIEKAVAVCFSSDVLDQYVAALRELSA